MIPISKRFFQEVCLNFFPLLLLVRYRDIARKIIPMKNARSAVNKSGSILTTKNLFAMIEKPDMIAVNKTRSVPRTSFFVISFFIVG